MLDGAVHGLSPFHAFENRVDPDQATPIGAALSVSKNIGTATDKV